MTRNRDLGDVAPFVDGVSSNIQTQINAKAPTASPTFTGTITADSRVDIVAASGFAVIEMGGPSGAFLDMKAPFSDDYDGRIQYDVGGVGAFIINTNSGNSSPVVIKQQDSEKLRTTTTGISVTGRVAADFLVPASNQTDPNDGSAYIYQQSGVGWDFAALNLMFSTGTSGNRAERMRINSSGDVNIVNELKAGSYNETFVTLTAAATVDVNCETGNVFALTTDQNTTFTFSNPPASGTAYGFMLRLTAGGTHTITYPASVDFAGAAAPDAPASGETDVLVFTTADGGTTWYGALAIDAAG